MSVMILSAKHIKSIGMSLSSYTNDPQTAEYAWPLIEKSRVEGLRIEEIISEMCGQAQLANAKSYAARYNEQIGPIEPLNSIWGEVCTPIECMKLIDALLYNIEDSILIGRLAEAVELMEDCRNNIARQIVKKTPAYNAAKYTL